MDTYKFLTIEINEPMLTAQTAAEFAAFSPNMAECARKFGHGYERYSFGKWLENKLLDEVNDKIADYFDRYMDEWHQDELFEADEKDEEFFETLMWPACEKCKLVDSYVGYHGVCVRGRRLQCTSSLGAEEWVNSEKYKEVLERIEKRKAEKQEGASHD